MILGLELVLKSTAELFFVLFFFLPVSSCTVPWSVVLNHIERSKQNSAKLVIYPSISSSIRIKKSGDIVFNMAQDKTRRCDYKVRVNQSA